MKFDKLAEILQTIRRLVELEFDSYGTGLDTVTISHYINPEDGSDVWAAYVDTRPRKPIDDVSALTLKVTKILKEVYPELPRILLYVRILN